MKHRNHTAAGLIKSTTSVSIFTPLNKTTLLRKQTLLSQKHRLYRRQILPYQKYHLYITGLILLGIIVLRFVRFILLGIVTSFAGFIFRIILVSIAFI